MSSTSNVLLVEDDPGDVRLAMAVFRKLHLEDRAVVVSDGEEAMDYLRSQGKFLQRAPGLPAFILLDLKLPRVNGFELLQQIKSDARLKLIPVVVLTSSRQERDVELAYEMGANGYIVKSIDFSSYMSTIRAVAVYWLTANEPPPSISQFRAIAVRQESTERNPAHWPVVNVWLRAWRHCRQATLAYCSTATGVL